MDRKQLLQFAIAGVQSQLIELQNELAAITKGVKKGVQVLAEGKPVKRRKVRRFTAAARKAASERMKAYWAKRRKR